LSRSIAASNASRTFGSSSSRFFGFLGLELKIHSWNSMPGEMLTVLPAFFTVSTAVTGSPLIASMLPLLRAVTMASSLEKYCTPKPAIFGLVPYQCGLAL
jgi:hypothetical protein